MSVGWVWGVSLIDLLRLGRSVSNDACDYGKVLIIMEWLGNNNPVCGGPFVLCCEYKECVCVDVRCVGVGVGDVGMHGCL